MAGKGKLIFEAPQRTRQNSKRNSGQISFLAPTSLETSVAKKPRHNELCANCFIKIKKVFKPLVSKDFIVTEEFDHQVKDIYAHVLDIVKTCESESRKQEQLDTIAQLITNDFGPSTSTQNTQVDNSGSEQTLTELSSADTWTLTNLQ